MWGANQLVPPELAKFSEKTSVYTAIALVAIVCSTWLIVACRIFGPAAISSLIRWIRKFQDAFTVTGETGSQDSSDVP
jgi:hypothetical protein